MLLNVIDHKGYDVRLKLLQRFVVLDNDWNAMISIDVGWLLKLVPIVLVLNDVTKGELYLERFNLSSVDGVNVLEDVIIASEVIQVVFLVGTVIVFLIAFIPVDVLVEYSPKRFLVLWLIAP